MSGIAYRAMVFFFCLNLGSFIVGQAEIFTVTEGLTPLNQTQYLQTFNASQMVDTYAESQDPTSDIAGTKYALSFFWNVVRGMLTGFPDFLATIPFVPNYFTWSIYALWLFMLVGWVAGFIRGRGVDE